MAQNLKRARTHYWHCKRFNGPADGLNDLIHKSQITKEKDQNYIEIQHANIFIKAVSIHCFTSVFYGHSTHSNVWSALNNLVEVNMGILSLLSQIVPHKTATDIWLHSKKWE